MPDQSESTHTCCACFTHNGLPCCNAGHPEGPPFCETKGCRGRWGWPTREHTLCALTPVRSTPASAALPTVGEPIGGCIQIGHYGPHDATPDCLLSDTQGRSVNPEEGS